VFFTSTISAAGSALLVPQPISAGFRRGAGLPPTGGLPPNPLIFWLMIDVSLVILIEDFEINQKVTQCRSGRVSANWGTN